MQPDLSKLDATLEERGIDGYLIDADSSESDQLYLSGYDAPDPFTTLYVDGEVHLLVSGLEYGRAKNQSRGDTVSRTADYGLYDLLEEYEPAEASSRVRAAFLEDHGVESVLCPRRFPLGVADGLREAGIEVTAETDSVLEDIRAVKTTEEIEHVRATQQANQKAMAAAEDLLAAATVEDGLLYYEGELLTSERVKEEIEITLLGHGCALDETIVACGADAAEAHNRGSGPLAADESIVIDIFPKDKETKYFGDMTRTFVVGEPSEEIRRRFEVTEGAFEAALDALEPGATGGEVHDAVCDVYEDAGYPTLRSDGTTEVGFIHSTGHGVGLDVHDPPSVGPTGDELVPGHVVTIEPGLYDPDVGGVRLEDLVVVTDDGYENLNEYPKELVVG